jgi:hypothetical protein
MIAVDCAHDRITVLRYAMAHNPDIAAAIDHLEKFLDQGDWRARLAAHRDALLEPVLAAAKMDAADLLLTLQECGLLASFGAYVDDAFYSARHEPDGTTLIDAYLKRRGWQETPRARAYLEGMRDSRPAVWEVRATEPGEWVDVCDRLGDGALVRVTERSASEMLHRYDRLIARVVRVREDVHMFTGGVLMLTHDVADRLEAELRRLVKAGKSTGEAITATCIRFWTIALLRQRSRPLPELHTTHGEPLLMGVTRLSLAPGVTAQEVARKLDSAEQQGWVCMGGGDEPGWLWFGADDAADETSMTQRTILATVRPGGPDAFVVETMSKVRMERALEALGSLLGNLVTPGLTRYEDPLQALSRARPAPGPRDNEIDPASAAEVVRQVTDAHYRRTLDDQVPMLGDRTPRECARTKAGRKKLVAWLKYLENAELHRARDEGREPYDFGWMWRDLGVENER